MSSFVTRRLSAVGALGAVATGAVLVSAVQDALFAAQGADDEAWDNAVRAAVEASVTGG